MLFSFLPSVLSSSAPWPRTHAVSVDNVSCTSTDIYLSDWAGSRCPLSQHLHPTAPAANPTTVYHCTDCHGQHRWWRKALATSWVSRFEQSCVCGRAQRHRHVWCTPSPCFAPFFFNAPSQFKPFLNVRSLILGLTPFGWLPSITLTPYLWWKYNFFNYTHIYSYTTRA